MAYTEQRGKGKNAYYIARYSDGKGHWPTVKDDTGRTLRFRKERDAQKAGNDKEAQVRAGKNPEAEAAIGTRTFGSWANEWYRDLDLAPSTMQNYRHHLEEHLLPAFEDTPLNEIDVGKWEADERAAGYLPGSIRTWRTTLHTVLADAVDAGIMKTNPAARRRRRGRRSGRNRARGVEKVITDPLGALLIAERAAILSGRDDEFVACVLLYYTGLRWGELVGLETRYVRSDSIRVEWQLWEDEHGVLHVLPPKDDSRRNIALPVWLAQLLKEHLARKRPEKCACHGRTYVFHGRGGPTKKPTIKDVARHSGVSASTVSLTLNHPERVAEATAQRVTNAITELGFDRTIGSAHAGVHWSNGGFGDSIFEPAATGRYPKQGKNKPRRMVPLTATPWPGTPVRGRNNQARAETCWTTIADGLTPHGMRHSHKAQMSRFRTPAVLSYDRMGHTLPGIGGVYDHILPEMVAELMADLTESWTAALTARRAMHARSPVATLDQLLAA